MKDSETKSKFDNVYRCKHSLHDGIFWATNVMIAGKKVVIFGYGDVDKVYDEAIIGCYVRVCVTEIYPNCALWKCMKGL